MACMRLVVALASMLVLAVACDETRTITQDEIDAGGIECPRGQTPRFGTCYCENDTGCPAEQYCDAVIGQCRPRTVLPGQDAGPVGCISGAQRCAPVASSAPDAGKAPGAVQECQAGKWVDVETCPAGGYCAASATGYYCAVCENGKTRCKAGEATTLETCNEKGDEWVAAACPNDPMTGQPSLCKNDECQSCVPGTIRCSADGKSLETCKSDASGWSSAYCAITGQCVTAGGAHCIQPVCTPGEKRCKTGSTTVLEICADDGMGWTERDCTSFDQWATPKAVCQSNECYEPCATAARESSYLGCEYWATVAPNIADKAAFMGNAAPNTQPNATSEYAVVVSNPSATEAAHVKVTRMVGGAEVVAPSAPAADANGVITIAPKGLQTIRLPWQMIGNEDSNGNIDGETGKKAFAYRVVSDVPVSAYQFSPVTSKNGSTYSYTNDASLLLPAHILSTNYVVIAQEHITQESSGIFGNNSLDYSAFMSIVGTQADTKVTIRFASATKAGGGIAAQAMNSEATYTLGKFDVLQFISAPGGTKVCLDTPDYQMSGISRLCKWPSDPTGSIVSSDKPVAVFGGAVCTLKPFNKLACDHVEEQMVPFQNWGKRYVGAKAAFYKTSSGAPVVFPTAAPDYWRVVAGCGKSSCPNGTTVTIFPVPEAFSQPLCAGCNCSGGTCVMPPVEAGKPAPWLEFQSGSASNPGNFTVNADQPIMVAQYFTGEDANKGSAEGDPSLVIIPPVEQWRTSYNVLASPTLVHNYLALVTQSSQAGIKIDGQDINSMSPETKTLPGGYIVYRVAVSGGAHSITANAMVGVTVYGYDSYVSYGYTGGLDLVKITQIIPGG